MSEIPAAPKFPNLSPAARNLCGVYFAVGTFSTVGRSTVAAGHRPALDELLSHGVVHRESDRDAYRGTPYSVILADEAMDLADRRGRADVARCGPACLMPPDGGAGVGA